MKYIFLILTIFIASTVMLSCQGSDAGDVQDVVIVGGDTLGRNWDNLPSKEEADKLKELGLTPEQYAQILEQQKQQELQQLEGNGNDNQQEDNATPVDNAPKNTFSTEMYKEHTYTVETTDGREVIVGSSSKY